MREFLINLGRVLARGTMWSKRNLIIAVVSLAVVLLLAGMLFGGNKHAPRTSAAGPSASGSAQPTGTAPVPAAGSGAPTPRVSDTVVTVNGRKSVNPVIAGIALRFVNAWIHTHVILPPQPAQTTPVMGAPIPKAAWLAGIQACECTTLQLLVDFRTTDPLDVPVYKVVGNPVLSAAADGKVQITVPGDTYPVLVTVIQDRGQWLVDDVNITA